MRTFLSWLGLAHSPSVPPPVDVEALELANRLLRERDSARFQRDAQACTSARLTAENEKLLAALDCNDPAGQLLREQQHAKRLFDDLARVRAEADALRARVSLSPGSEAERHRRAAQVLSDALALAEGRNGGNHWPIGGESLVRAERVRAVVRRAIAAELGVDLEAVSS